MKSAAILTIEDAGKMTTAEKKRIAYWLRQQAKGLIKDGHLYAKKTTIRYLYCLVMLVMLFVAGCVSAYYGHKMKYVIVNNKPVLLSDEKVIKYSSCNVNIQGTGLDISSPNDVKITMKSRDMVADPNSGYAEAEMIKGFFWPMP
jgi:hypothetical protein